MPNPRSAGNERATVPRRRTPGNGRRETPSRVEGGAESRADRTRTCVGILRPFAVCRAGARDEEGEARGGLGLSASFPEFGQKTTCISCIGMTSSRPIAHTKRFSPLSAQIDVNALRAEKTPPSSLNFQREAVLRRAAARRPSDRGARVRESAFDGASRGTRGVRRRRARAVLRRPPGRRLRGMDRRVPRVDVDAVARGEKVHAKGGGDAHSGACARPPFPGGGASGSRAMRVALFSSLAPRRLRDRPPRARSRRTPPRNIT